MPVPTDHEEDVEEQEELSGQMSFFDHLEELRRRIIHSLIAVGIAFGACLALGKPLFNMFSKLMEDNGAELNFSNLPDVFTIQLKMALMAAIFLVAPFLLAQVWLFVSPGLYRKERRYAGPFVIFSWLLFVIGGLFGYFVALPLGIQYLSNMAKDLGPRMLLDAQKAFDLVFALEVGLGVVFEIPAVIFLLSRIGLITGPFLLKNSKYALLGCFIVAAVITPTGDIPNMMIIAVPMLALYALGIVIAYVFGKKREKS